MFNVIPKYVLQTQLFKWPYLHPTTQALLSSEETLNGWDRLIVFMYIVFDLITAIAAFSIPAAIIYFFLIRKDLRPSKGVIAFGIVVAAVGLVHLLDGVNAWTEVNIVTTIFRGFAAILATVAAIGLWTMIPKLLLLPSRITLEQKNRALREANEKYDLLFEESTIGFFEWRDLHTNENIYWSRSLYRLFDKDPKLFSPSRSSFLQMIHPDDRPKVMSVVQFDGSVEESKPVDFRALVRGEYRWFRSSRRVRISGATNGFTMVGSVEDIHDSHLASEQMLYINRTLDEEVQKRTKQLAEANEAKSRFLAQMSHEIRTPLGLILGFSDLLSDDTELSSTSRDYVQLITKNGEILSRVVNDLLDLSKVEVGKLNFTFSSVCMFDVLEGIRTAFDTKAQKKGLTFNFTNILPPQMQFVTDEIRLKQILYNLISNSIKFTDIGGIQIVCGTSDTNDQLIYFDVFDTGQGVSLDDRERIFLDYEQGDSNHNVGEYGTGLGLRLSRSLARSLGGTVELVTSEVGHGSHFRLTITNQQQLAPVSLPKPDTRQSRSPMSGCKVFVLDDNEDNVRLAELFLKKLGCQVSGFVQPELFIQETLVTRPDLVLLDISMPIMNGFEVFSALRAADFQNPIWALTAHALNDDVQAILKHGFDAYIPKPINLARLRQKLVIEFNEVRYG